MRLTRTRRYLLLRNTAKQLLPGRFPEPGPVDDGPALESAEPVLMAWPAGVRKPLVGLVRDLDAYPYWTKYRRFLAANDIPYELYDIHRSSWLSEAQRYDLILWRPMSYPFELEECRRKFHLLEQRLGLLCYPSFAEVQLYEDKISQYELLRHHGLPVVETFISASEAETLAYLARCRYPLVWKITAGSGSLGVELVRNRRTAERWTRRVFGAAGRRTYWPYLNQKNYVYLQRFVPGARYDLRVIVVGDTVFGYYRDVPPGEFRASGMDTMRWQSLPLPAMRLARRVARVLDAPCLAVDVLLDSDEGPLIIEVSTFTQLRSPAQLRIDRVPGVYVFADTGDEHRFVPRRVWTAELALKHVLETRWLTLVKAEGQALATTSEV